MVTWNSNGISFRVELYTAGPCAGAGEGGGVTAASPS